MTENKELLEAIKDAHWDMTYDFQKELRQKHQYQHTACVQFERSDNAGMKAIHDDPEPLLTYDYVGMAAACRLFLPDLIGNRSPSLLHIAAYNADGHPAFAAALTAECARQGVSLTLIHWKPDGTIREQTLL